MFSVIGIAAGVATLVIALSMNTGFRRTIQDRLLGVSAHVNLTRPGAEGIADYRALGERLRHVDDVRSVFSGHLSDSAAFRKRPCAGRRDKGV